MTILLKNLTIVSTTEVTTGQDIFIKDGIIEKIGTGLKETCDTVLDLSGKIAFPAFFDMHTHMRDPGFTYKEDIETGTKAALHGGFWGVAAMPNTSPVTDNVPVVEYIINKANKFGYAKVFPVAAITKGLEGKELTEMIELKAHGAIAVSDDGKPVSDSNTMRQALRYAHMAGMPVVCHSEDLSLVNGGVMNEGATADRLGLRGITRAAEEAAIAREIILAKSYNLPVHITHISTKGSVELIRNAKKEGVQVTCDTCPHYFSLTDEACEGYDTHAKMNPPLREAFDVDAIIEGLQDGTIDAIATDHAPHHFDEKKVEFDHALNCIIGLETSFAVACTYLYHTKKLSLSKIAELMADTPCKILNLTPAEIKVGNVANITVCDLNEIWMPTPENTVSKSKNSPYYGRELCGKVTTVITDGVLKLS